MGNGPATARGELIKVRSRLGQEIGTVAVSGRYHLLPRRVDDDYDVDRKKELGTGYNGAVLSGKHKVSGALVAVKDLKLFGLSKVELRNLRNEVELFLGMDHPHIARLLDVYEGESTLTLVMECLQGGELFDRLKREQAFSERDAANTAKMMLLAINYLHSKNIVHRDIKLENFLYESRDYSFLKLIDFGFSRHHKNVSKKMSLACGTAPYWAPEVLDGDYDNKCDLWAAGVTVFILLMGYMPFGSESEQEARIRAGNMVIREDRWERLSEHARDFVTRLLKVKPAERMSAQEALEHPWLNDMDQLSEKPVVNRDELVTGMRAYAKSSKFRRACMSLMAWSLTNEERSEMRKAFLAIDADGTGFIRLVELKKVLEDHVTITDNEIKDIFKSLDQDCDDEVSYSDFLSAMVASSIALNDNLIRGAFRRLDVDNSGFITVENLRAVLGETSSEAEIQRLMQLIDVSKDGLISLEEFETYLRTPDQDAGVAALRVIDKQRKSLTEPPVLTPEMIAAANKKKKGSIACTVS